MPADRPSSVHIGLQRQAVERPVHLAIGGNPAVDRATRQLKDHKSKLRDNKHHISTGGKDV